MNKSNAHAYKHLLDALMEGKTIQQEVRPARWEDLGEVTFYKLPNEYRIKPEPREFNVGIRNDGIIVDLRNVTPEELNLYHSSGQHIKVREVME